MRWKTLATLVVLLALSLVLLNLGIGWMAWVVPGLLLAWMVGWALNWWPGG